MFDEMIGSIRKAFWSRENPLSGIWDIIPDLVSELSEVELTVLSSEILMAIAQGKLPNIEFEVADRMQPQGEDYEFKYFLQVACMGYLEASVLTEPALADLAQAHDTLTFKKSYDQKD